MGPLDSINKIVDAAKNGTAIDLDKTETRDIANTQPTLITEGQTKLDTAGKLQKLADEIREEKTEHAPLGEISAVEAADLESAAVAIETHTPTPTPPPAPPAAPPAVPPTTPVPPDVGDIFVPKPDDKKSIVDKAKDFFENSGAVGSILKAYIGFKRMMMSLFPPANPAEEEKALQGIDRLYGMAFGGKEVRDQMNTVLTALGKNLKVVRGSKDNVGYEKLKSDYRAEITRLAGAGATPEKIAETMTANTFEVFVESRINTYFTDKETAGDIDATPGTTKKYDITVFGVAHGQKPKEV